MNEPDYIPGFFGKVPSQTEFAHRRLPLDFVRPWENWLQASLRSSQRVLGDNWMDTYLSSHIWRFVLQTEVCGEDAWAGVLMPSVDQQGHSFPLTIAVRINSSQGTKNLFDHAETWFDHLERLALFSLSDDSDIAHLDDLLQKLTPLKKRSGVGFRFFFSKPKTGHTLWRVTGYDHLSPGIRAFRGLPSPADFVGLLTSHTSSKRSVSPPPPQTPPDECTRTVLHNKFASSKVNDSLSGWRSWALTNVGMRRKINEDAFLDRPEVGLWVVADGMGGHSAGDVASRTVVDRLGQISPLGKGSPLGSPTQSLAGLETVTQQQLQEVNAELLGLAKEMGPGHVVGTTVVAMLAVGQTCTALWAGDSRLYRHREGKLEQLTADHSMAAEMAKVPNAMPNGYGDNIVTRALGADPVLEVDRMEFEAQPGDLYLLCSDGLVKELHTTEIEKILTEESCERSVRRLIDLALERQARDNVTLILISAEPSV